MKCYLASVSLAAIRDDDYKKLGQCESFIRQTSRIELSGRLYIYREGRDISKMKQIHTNNICRLYATEQMIFTLGHGWCFFKRGELGKPTFETKQKGRADVVEEWPYEVDFYFGIEERVL